MLSIAERHKYILEKLEKYGFIRITDVAEELGVTLLGQIPLVQSICDGGDAGHPVALDDTASGLAFRLLATEVINAVERRNNTQPATQKVELNH